MGKLQMKDLQKKPLEKELEREEYNYDQIVANLSKAKQERRTHTRKIQKEKTAKQFEVDEVDHFLQMARAEKNHESLKVESIGDEMKELLEEEKSLQRDIAELERAIGRDKALVTSLDAEIDKLQIEKEVKLKQVIEEQARISRKSSVASDRRDSVNQSAPDINHFHTSLTFLSQQQRDRIQTIDDNFLYIEENKEDNSFSSQNSSRILNENDLDVSVQS